MSSYLPEDQRPLLPPGAGPFERHVFVCVTGKTCPLEGAEAVHAAMKSLAKERLGKHRVRINKSGCLGQCGHGPMLVVYPDDVWYAHVRVEDVPEIVESHLERGVPVERLLFRGHRVGNNTLVKE
jgi:(2Fe-2S) ferredoxin